MNFRICPSLRKSQEIVFMQFTLLAMTHLYEFYVISSTQRIKFDNVNEHVSKIYICL